MRRGAGRPRLWTALHQMMSPAGIGRTAGGRTPPLSGWRGGGADRTRRAWRPGGEGGVGGRGRRSAAPSFVSTPSVADAARRRALALGLEVRARAVGVLPPLLEALVPLPRLLPHLLRALVDLAPARALLLARANGLRRLPLRLAQRVPGVAVRLRVRRRRAAQVDRRSRPVLGLVAAAEGVALWGRRGARVGDGVQEAGR